MSSVLMQNSSYENFFNYFFNHVNFCHLLFSVLKRSNFALGRNCGIELEIQQQTEKKQTFKKKPVAKNSCLLDLTETLCIQSKFCFFSSLGGRMKPDTL